MAPCAQAAAPCAQVSAACGGPHYGDCEIQLQRSGCNAHFGNASFHAVHGPANARSVAAALQRGARGEATRAKLLDGAHAHVHVHAHAHTHAHAHAHGPGAERQAAAVGADGHGRREADSLLRRRHS